MAQDEKRRQKALLKKKKKDEERKKRTAAKAGLIRKARQFPMYECLVNKGWQDQGLAHILLSRKQPNNELMIGVFLVDIYCLGLKNTFSNANISPGEYEKFKFKMYEESFIPCDPLLADRIIYGAIEYARTLGFEPQKDFALSRFILDEPSDARLSFDVKFGMNGKPLYIVGPNDNMDHVIKQLIKNVGEGNFDYFLPVK